MLLLQRLKRRSVDQRNGKLLTFLGSARDILETLDELLVLIVIVAPDIPVAST